ncbi:MAG: hypothetical protein QXU69_04480, partial [Thermofilaceae archaeon]
ASKKGWDVSRIAEHPIDQVFAEALRRREEYEKLKEEVEELRRLVEYYESNYGPLEYARNLVKVLKEAVVALAVMKRAGFRVSRDNPVVSFYNKLLKAMIKGYRLEVE